MSRNCSQLNSSNYSFSFSFSFGSNSYRLLIWRRFLSAPNSRLQTLDSRLSTLIQAAAVKYRWDESKGKQTSVRRPISSQTNLPLSCLSKTRYLLAIRTATDRHQMQWQIGSFCDQFPLLSGSINLWRHWTNWITGSTQQTNTGKVNRENERQTNNLVLTMRRKLALFVELAER